jgi:hypothetical protein
MVRPGMDRPAVLHILNTSIAHTIIVGTTMPRPIGPRPGGRDVSRIEGDSLTSRSRRRRARDAVRGFLPITIHSFKGVPGAACDR